METLTFDVRGQRLTGTNDVELVPGTLGYVVARFTFDGDWNRCKKVAVFSSVKLEDTAVPIINNACAIPEEVLAKQAFHIRLVGARTGYRITTNKVSIHQGVR